MTSKEKTMYVTISEDYLIVKDSKKLLNSLYVLQRQFFLVDFLRIDKTITIANSDFKVQAFVNKDFGTISYDIYLINNFREKFLMNIYTTLKFAKFSTNWGRICPNTFNAIGIIHTLDDTTKKKYSKGKSLIAPYSYVATLDYAKESKFRIFNFKFNEVKIPNIIIEIKEIEKLSAFLSSGTHKIATKIAELLKSRGSSYLVYNLNSNNSICLWDKKIYCPIVVSKINRSKAEFIFASNNFTPNNLKDDDYDISITLMLNLFHSKREMIYQIQEVLRLNEAQAKLYFKAR